MPRGVYPRTQAHRDAISKAKRGVSSPAIQAAARKRSADPEYQAKMIDVYADPVRNAKIAEGRRGYVHDQASRDALSAARTVHGMSKHPLFSVWMNMIYRCTDPDHRDFRNYGGRGIAVCDGWLRDPVAFITYVDAELGPRSAGYTLDRVDNEGNYEPGNLRWATRAQQSQNRRPASEWRNARGSNAS